MTIRAATPADAAGIARVHVYTWQAAYRHVFAAEVLDGLSVGQHERWWSGVLESGSEQVWVATDDETVVGFASAGASRSEEDAAELHAIYVLPECWGNGAAPELMRAAVGWFRAENYTTAMLTVLADNPRARRFYEREGWRFDREEPHEARGVTVQSALYRLSLAGA